MNSSFSRDLSLFTAALTCSLSVAASAQVVNVHFPRNGRIAMFEGAGTDLHRAYDFPGVERVRSDATGFFRLERVNGKWWFIDPNGLGFWHAGMNGVKLGKFGFGKGKEDYAAGMKARFADTEAYIEHLRSDLGRGGYNSVLMPAADPLGAVMPFVRIANQRGFHGWNSHGNLGHKLHENPGWHDVSNPFHPDFAAWCDEEARVVTLPVKGSPWLIGYQLANEMDWYGPDSAIRVMRHPADHHAKIALVELAEEHFGGIEAYNAAWGSSFSSFEGLLNDQSPPPAPPTEEATGFGWRFIETAYDTWLGTLAGAFRKHDPNHLLLGVRQHTHNYPDKFNKNWWRISGEHLDAVSINAYSSNAGVDPQRGIASTTHEHFAEIAELSGKPLINSEWYNNGEDPRVFEKFQSYMIASPDFIGSQFFSYAGHRGLAYTIWEEDGTSTYQPKPELEAISAEINGRIPELRLGTSPLEFVFEAEASRQWNQELPPRVATGQTRSFKIGPLEYRKNDQGWKIFRDGQKWQFLQPTVHQIFDNQDRWLRSVEHEVVARYENGGWLVLDSRLEQPGTSAAGIDAGGGKAPSGTDALAMGYTLSLRTWISKEEPGVYVTQVLGVTNLSQNSWFMESVTQGSQSLLGETGEDDTPFNFLELYYTSGWQDPESSVAYASFAPDGLTPSKTRKFEGGGRENGRSQKTEVELVGSQSWTPPQPATSVHMLIDLSEGKDALRERIRGLANQWFTEAKPAEYKSAFPDT